MIKECRHKIIGSLAITAVAFATMIGSAVFSSRNASAAGKTQKVYFNGYSFMFPAGSWEYVPDVSVDAEDEETFFAPGSSHDLSIIQNPDKETNGTVFAMLSLRRMDTTYDSLEDDINDICDPYETGVSRTATILGKPSYRFLTDLQTGRLSQIGIIVFTKKNEAISVRITCGSNSAGQYANMLEAFENNKNYVRKISGKAPAYTEKYLKNLRISDNGILWTGRYPTIRIKVISSKKNGDLYDTLSSNGIIYRTSGKYKKNSTVTLKMTGISKDNGKRIVSVYH